MLEDSGIMCSLNQDKYKNHVSPDIESVGRFYSSMVKGYTGISIVTTYVLIFYSFSQTETTMITYLIVFIDPLALILLFVLISALIEMKLDKIKSIINNRIAKKGLDLSPQSIKIE